MAVRESRAGRRRLWLLTGAITAGVAALVAINSFTQNLRTSVADQAKAILGADLSITSRGAFTPRVEALLDSLIAPDSAAGRTAGQRALQVSFPGMGYVPRTKGVRLVQVRAVEKGYPFYGEITTLPAGLWSGLTEGDGALVDPALLAALGARIGDTLALGDARLPIIGTVLNVPGDVGMATAFGPRVYISARMLPATGLLAFGSRAEYDAFLKLPPGVEAEPIRLKYRLPLRAERASIASVEDEREDLTEALTRLGNYLGLVALIALLLGGLGVASAVHVFIKRKMDTIAVLRCLGATSHEVFAMYLLQALVMGGIGSALGALLGVGLQQVLPLLFRDLLPVNVRVVPSAGSILLGMSLGLWVAGMFAALPLLAVRRVSPLMTLRRDVEPARVRRDWIDRLSIALLALSVVALASIQVGELRGGLIFSAAIGLSLLFLWLAARGLIKGIRRWFPHGLPYLWRQGLANLYRPANQTVTVVLALGFGSSMLATLFLVQHNLLRQFRPGGEGTRPNLMFFDIQPAQRDGVAEVITAHQLTGTPLVPIVTMRIKSIRGVPVPLAPPPPPDSTPADSSAARGQPGGQGTGGQGAARSPTGWAARREYRSTYRDTLSPTETLVSGSWWGPGVPPPAPGFPALLSLETDIARDLGVAVGDEMVWEVQGAEIKARVANLRNVDWNRFSTNFFAVFQSGILESAPQMFVTLVRADSAEVRGQVQRAVAERFPNVTAIDLSQVQQAIDSILGRGAAIVRFLAGFSLITGAIVLVGAVSASRLARIREGVLLKTLGATRAQVLRILIAEYTALGALATLASVVLASVAAWALARWVFDTPFSLPVLELGALTLVLLILTLSVGLWNSAEILKRAPLAILREE
jgi:putative ABC transport system permease protein